MKKLNSGPDNVDEKLLSAAAKGDLDAVRERISAGAEINAAPKNDAPALFGAVASGNLDVVRALIAAGADVNRIAQPRYASVKTSPLCLAIEQGHWEVSRTLLEAGASVALEPNKGNNAADEAAQQAIKAYCVGHTSDEDWFGRRRKGREKEQAQQRCQQWAQFVRDAVGAGVRVRDYWLWSAAKCGYEEMVLLLIRAGTNVNAAPHRSTALNGAIENGHTGIAKALVEAGADLQALTDYEPAPLILAAAKDRTEIIPILLDAGADINATGSIAVGGFGAEEVEEKTDAKGNVVIRTTHFPNPPVAEASTALVIAVRRGNHPLARLLIERGADLNLGDKQGVTPLGWALRLNHQATVERLRAAGAAEPEFVEGSAASALLAAARNGETSTVEQFISRGVKPNEPLKDREGLHLPLVEAARSGSLATVRALLNGGADVNAAAQAGFTGGITPLMVASEGGHVEVMQALIAAGANIEAKDIGFEDGGETALHYAARAGSAAAIEALAAEGAKVNAKAKGGSTPLLVAVAERKITAVKALLRAGADANAGPSDGSGPLWQAADEHDAALVSLLLQHGASPIPRAKKPVFLPLAAAASKGSVEVVRLLLQASAPINALGVHGGTALSDAALFGHEDVVAILLAAGADPNTTDQEGFSPLMAAVRSGKPGIVQRLLEAGADVGRTNESNETALDMAKQARNRAIIALLENAGGKTETTVRRESDRRSPSGRKKDSAEEPEPPDFSEAAKLPAYQAAVLEVARLCEATAEPLGNLVGGFLFATPREKLETVLKEHQQRLREQGAFLFRQHRDFSGNKDKLGLLPTRAWADVICALQTNAANYDLMPSDIVKWLVKVSDAHPFTLTGAGSDWLEGCFTQPVQNSRKLARKMAEFCPDIVDQGIGSVKALAQELEKNGTFFFWWD